MTKIVKSTKKTKETAIAKTDNPLSLESLRKVLIPNFLLKILLT